MMFHVKHELYEGFRFVSRETAFFTQTARSFVSRETPIILTNAYVSRETLNSNTVQQFICAPLFLHLI